jgi:hypothetical protein
MNNENLEKIKQLCDVEVPYNEVCSIHANALGEIQEAAECMAREIERFETADVLSDEVALKNTKYIEELEAEITQLKAELEKRPKVVRCVECKVLEDDIESDESGGFCHYIRKYCSPEDFCSHAQHKESEEK